MSEQETRTADSIKEQYELIQLRNRLDHETKIKSLEYRATEERKLRSLEKEENLYLLQRTEGELQELLLIEKAATEKHHRVLLEMKSELRLLPTGIGLFISLGFAVVAVLLIILPSFTETINISENAQIILSVVLLASLSGAHQFYYHWKILKEKEG